MSVWSKRGGEKRLIRVPMFPGYLFVRDAMDKKSYVEILKARGVVRILEDGWTRLTPIPDRRDRRHSAGRQRRCAGVPA